MDKRDYAIIGLLLVIIAMLSYGVINAYNESQPEVFEFSDYIITAPAGSHYHNENGNCSIYLHENDSYMAFFVSDIGGMPVEGFDSLYNSLKNGSISKDVLIKGMMGEFNDGSSVSDINAGDFKGEPEVSMNIQISNNPSQRYLVHLVKHNNKVFMFMEQINNPSSNQMYTNIIFK